MLKGPPRPVRKVCRAEIRPGRGKDQPEQRSPFGGKGDVAQPGRHHLCLWVGRGKGLFRLHRQDELPVAFCRKGSQQPGCIAEMMGRGGVADPGAPGDPAQGKRLEPGFGQFRLGSRQQRRMRCIWRWRWGWC